MIFWETRGHLAKKFYKIFHILHKWTFIYYELITDHYPSINFGICLYDFINNMKEDISNVWKMKPIKNTYRKFIKILVGSCYQSNYIQQI